MDCRKTFFESFCSSLYCLFMTVVTWESRLYSRTIEHGDMIALRNILALYTCLCCLTPSSNKSHVFLPIKMRREGPATLIRLSSRAYRGHSRRKKRIHGQTASSSSYCITTYTTFLIWSCIIDLISGRYYNKKEKKKRISLHQKAVIISPRRPLVLSFLCRFDCAMSMNC